MIANDRRATQQMAGIDVVARAPIFVISYSVVDFGDDLLSARWAVSSTTSGDCGRSEHPKDTLGQGERVMSVIGWESERYWIGNLLYCPAGEKCGRPWMWWSSLPSLRLPMTDPRVWLGTKDHKILPRSLLLRDPTGY